MDYKFKTTDFEGPLDLLLHLIKSENMDIFNINIADITEQYLRYIENLKSLDLNVDSEYLTVASELIHLKSRELLPHETEDEEDPKEEFINRLVEYKKYKEISSIFKRMEEERKKFYDKLPSELEQFHSKNINIDEDITLDDLVNAFIKFNEKVESLKPLNTVVTKKEYSVHKRASEIIKKINKYKKVKFEQLFEKREKSYVVVTFLAILNLAKDGKLNIYQDSELDSIVLSNKGE
ncbi:MAG: segregation/condensation protein A [Bacilli bacterium]|nr:segregation/condensation protein A [Bacilli bacterium]